MGYYTIDKHADQINICSQPNYAPAELLVPFFLRRKFWKVQGTKQCFLDNYLYPGGLWEQGSRTVDKEIYLFTEKFNLSVSTGKVPEVLYLSMYKYITLDRTSYWALEGHWWVKCQCTLTKDRWQMFNNWFLNIGCLFHVQEKLILPFQK